MKKADAAKIVRVLMQSYGKSIVYTNSYKSGTKTVKCYAGARDDALIQVIRRTLRAAGFVQYKFNRTIPNHEKVSRWIRPSLIVKLTGHD